MMTIPSSGLGPSLGRSVSLFHLDPQLENLLLPRLELYVGLHRHATLLRLGHPFCAMSASR